MKDLRRFIPVIAAATVLSVASTAFAQAASSLTSTVPSGQQTSTLGEIAKKEEERRKATTPAAKVYTNKDLPKPVAPQPAAPGTLPPPVAPAADQKAADAEKDKTDKPAEDVKDEAWWRARMTVARTELQRNEMALEAFQSRVNALSTDFAARDDPYQRAQLAIDRQKTLGELERIKSEIVRLKQQIGEIEEEARLAGVPPGWLR